MTTRWELTPETYWRLQGQDVLLFSKGAVLHFNSIHAAAFKSLFGIRNGDGRCDAREMEDFENYLLVRGMATRSEGDHDPWQQHCDRIKVSEVRSEVGSGTEPMLFFDRESQRLKAGLGIISRKTFPQRNKFDSIFLVGREWRNAAPEEIIEDIRLIERLNKRTYQHFYFLDANFFVEASRTLEAARAIAEHRPDMTFSFSTRVPQLMRGQKFLPELREYGLRAVEIDIARGDAEISEHEAQAITPEQEKEASALLREHRLEVYLRLRHTQGES